MWVIKNDELYHHGVKGQEWGRVNGPPYPLAAGDHSASEKKAGWRQSLSEKIKTSRTQRKRVKALKKARAAKIKKAEDAKNKEKNMKNPVWLKKHAGELTNEELRAAKERIGLENDLRQQSIRKMNAGKEYIDLVLGYAKTGVDAFDTASGIYDRVKDAKKKKDEKSKEKKFKKEAEGMSLEDIEKYNTRYDAEKAYVDRKLGRPTNGKKNGKKGSKK